MQTYLDPAISYFARVDFRDDKRLFGIRHDDLLAGGMLILGKTGNGKSNLIKTLAFNDIIQGKNHMRGGFALIDAHSDLVREVHALIPEHRKKDVIYLDPVDPTCTWGYNPLRKVKDMDTRALIASSIIETFRKVFGEQAWGVRLEYTLRQVLLLLQDTPFEVTLDDVPRLLLDEPFRQRCLPYAQNPHVKRFFEKEYPRYSKGDILPVLSKVNSFLSIPSLRRILIENKKQLSMAAIMQDKQILLVNLSKAKVGTDGVTLLGGLLISAMVSAGFGRLDIPSHRREPFILYLDEAGLYATRSIVNAVSELRKTKFNIVFGLQYLEQLTPDIRNAILGNIGTVVCFRLGQDAKMMEKIFTPEFVASDFQNLERYHVYIKMLIKGTSSKGFSARTITVENLK